MTGLMKDTMSQLRLVSDGLRVRFGLLSERQLNWQPAVGRWSVGQCFDHLVTTHSLYEPLFDRLAGGQNVPSLWERVSPLSGFFGRFLIKGMHPDNAKKMKTTARAQPAAGTTNPDIIDRFCAHQRDLIDRIQRIPDELDLSKTIITSPLLGLVTYSLEDCLTILLVHCRRHSGQARRVMADADFPT